MNDEYEVDDDNHMLRLVGKYSFGHAYSILESYGYEYVYGDHETRHLLMCNLDEFKFVRVIGNQYFGTKPEIITLDEIEKNPSYDDAVGNYFYLHKRSLLERCKE